MITLEKRVNFLGPLKIMRLLVKKSKIVLNTISLASNNLPVREKYVDVYMLCNPVLFFVPSDPDVATTRNDIL